MAGLAGLAWKLLAAKGQADTGAGVLAIEVNEPYPYVVLDGEVVTVSWNDSGRKGELRAAMLEALKQDATRPDDAEGPHPLWKDPWHSFQQFHQNHVIALLDYGEPFPPLRDAPEREFVPVALRPSA